MKKSDFSKLVESRHYGGLLESRVPTIKTKLNFFRDELGLSDPELCKLLVKCPRVMEHRLESTVRPHLEFLQLHGVPQHDLGKASAPLRSETCL